MPRLDAEVAVLLTSVELDDLLLLEEIRKVLSFGKGDDFPAELSYIRLHVCGNACAFKVIVSCDPSACRSIAESELWARPWRLLRVGAPAVPSEGVHLIRVGATALLTYRL